jgi:hypothetical protein
MKRARRGGPTKNRPVSAARGGKRLTRRALRREWARWVRKYEAGRRERAVVRWRRIGSQGGMRVVRAGRAVVRVRG